MEPELHYHVHNRPPPIPLLSHMDPVNINIPNIFKINCNIILNPRQDLPSGFFPSGSPTAICYAFLVSSISATHLTRFFLLDFIILKMPGKEHTV
jgi:hypothetical protein